MTTIITTGEAILWTTRISIVFILIDSCGKIIINREYNAGGIFSWEVLRTYRYFKTGYDWTKPVLNIIYNNKIWLLILSLRGLSALLLLLTPASGLMSSGCLFIIFAVTSLINLRMRPFAAETENRMLVMITGALLMRSMMPDELVTKSCLWFIALQSCLTYITAGISKVFNEDWRKGIGFYKVFAAPDFSETISLFFIRRRLFAKFLNYAVIVAECLFPMVLILKRPYALVILLLGVIFHFAIAIVFNFGKFFLIWIATYPAILFIMQR